MSVPDGSTVVVSKGALPLAVVASPQSNLKVEFLWTAAGNIVYAACQWSMLALLVKNCSALEVGRFALGLAITGPIILFSNLQLRAVQATDATGRHTFAEYVQLRLWTTAAAMLCILGVCARQTGIASTGLVVVVLGASKMFESVSDVLQGYLQQQERMQVIARSLIAKGLLGAAVVWLATLLWHQALGAAIGVAAISAVMLALYDWPMTARLRELRHEKGESRREAQIGRLGSLTLLAAPLGIVQGLVSLSANIPRYLLEHSAGLAAVGIYSALASLIVIGQTVVNALGNVVSPRLARLYAQGDTRTFQSLLGKTIAVGFLVGLMGMAVARLAGGLILTILFRPEYAMHSHVLVIIMAGATLAYVAWFAGFGLTAAGIFKEQIPLLAVVCLTIWGAGQYWVSRNGIEGAAAAFTIAMAVQAVGACSVLWFALRKRAERCGELEI